MEDKELARIKYLEFMKEQRRLERELAKVDKEEWDVVSKKNKTTQEYLKLPELPPIELVVLSEEETKNRDKKKGKAYGGDLYQAPKERRARRRRNAYFDNYWDDNPDPDKVQDTEAAIKARRNRSSKEYYRRNKEKCLEKTKAYRERNREKQKEYYRDYMRRRKEEKIKREASKYNPEVIETPPNDYRLKHPSVFRTVITADGCNTCGDKLHLYLFKNKDNEYTGCLCQKCLSTYETSSMMDSTWLFKVRQYIRDRQRASHQYATKNEVHEDGTGHLQPT